MRVLSILAIVNASTELRFQIKRNVLQYQGHDNDTHTQNQYKRNGLIQCEKNNNNREMITMENVRQRDTSLASLTAGMISQRKQMQPWGTN